MASSTLESPAVSSPSFEEVAWVFKALSDPTRLKILHHLALQDDGACCGNGEGVCACDLETVTGLKQPTVSHHMKCLMSAQLISAEKKGKWTYYQINAQGLQVIEPTLRTLANIES